MRVGFISWNTDFNPITLAFLLQCSLWNNHCVFNHFPTCKKKTNKKKTCCISLTSLCIENLLFTLHIELPSPLPGTTVLLDSGMNRNVPQHKILHSINPHNFPQNSFKMLFPNYLLLSANFILHLQMFSSLYILGKLLQLLTWRLYGKKSQTLALTYTKHRHRQCIKPWK